MLAVRVIPCLDVANGRVVKGTRFVDLVDEGDPPELAERYAARGRRRDRLPRHHGRARGSRHAPRRSSSGRRGAPSCPLTVGGGVRTRGRDAGRAAGRGRQGVAQHGRRRRPRPRPALRAAVRVAGRRRRHRRPPSRRLPRPASRPAWEVVVKGGREGTGLDAVAWAERVVGPRRRRAAGHLDRPRRHPVRLRHGAPAGHRRPRARAGGRLGRRGRARRTSWRPSATAARRPCSPPRSSTAASTRSRPSRRPWRRPASRSGRCRRPRRERPRAPLPRRPARRRRRPSATTPTGLVPGRRPGRRRRPGPDGRLDGRRGAGRDAGDRARSTSTRARAGALWRKGETSGNILRLRGPRPRLRRRRAPGAGSSRPGRPATAASGAASIPTARRRRRRRPTGAGRRRGPGLRLARDALGDHRRPGRDRVPRARTRRGSWPPASTGPPARSPRRPPRS